MLLKVPRDGFTAHLTEMRALNAAYKKILIGSRRRPRLHLVFRTVRGEVLITSKISGTTARAGDATERAVLLQEVGLWLEFVRLRLRWELAPKGPRRERAARTFLKHLKAMKAAKDAKGKAEA